MYWYKVIESNDRQKPRSAVHCTLLIKYTNRDITIIISIEKKTVLFNKKLNNYAVH